MKKRLPIRVKILLAFLGIVVFVILLFFLTNHIFWNRVVISGDREVLLQTYQEIAALFRKPGTREDDLQEILESVKTKQNMTCAIQGDSDWEFRMVSRQMMSPLEREFLMSRLKENFLSAANEGVTVLSTGNNYTIQMVEIAGDNHRYIECYGYVKNNSDVDKKIILSIPLENLFEMSAASNRYFVAIGILLMLLGGLVIFLVTMRLTKPILTLSELSKRMTDLDFSAKYESRSNDEIGVLGENMNRMSEKLENTIHELQEANAILQKDIEEKNRVDDMRKEFIANVSHELKTPIALIQGYAEGLKEFKDDPASLDDYCDIIIDESDKMNRMVKKLTTLNQLEFGSGDFAEVEFDIMEMIRELAAGMEKTMQGAGTVSVDGPESLFVIGDEFKIEEVLMNYLSNAKNHLKEPNEIRIAAEERGAFVRVSVTNTGDPIPETELSKIWIKFYKVDKARTRAYGGSGIGLSIVKAIMEAHQTDYGVQNVDNGVLFYFELRKAGEESNGLF